MQIKQTKQTSTETPKGQVILYGNRLEVRLEQDTVWLTQKQMAELFQKDVRTINEHVTNIYEERELTKKPTIRKFRIVQKEGERIVERYIDFYNLDVIISVGYRVKSLRGTQFIVGTISDPANSNRMLVISTVVASNLGQKGAGLMNLKIRPRPENETKRNKADIELRKEILSRNEPAS
jgi:hypothetical protein